MQNEQTTAVIPHGRYRRCVEGADFSLEANTESVPEPEHFYILRNGRVVLRSDDFQQAVEEYQSLCREFWSDRLASRDQDVRLQSAWGLLALEPDHPAARKQLQELGTPADQKRLQQMRFRKRGGTGWRFPGKK